MKLLSANLHAFYEVAQLGSVHGAARSLKITQTAITRRIAALESDLHASLFLRSRRGMTLTEDGLALLRYCRQAAELEGETLARLGGLSEQPERRLIVQGPSSVMRSRVIPSLSQVMVSKFPQVELEFHLSDRESTMDRLKSGACDLLIAPKREVVAECDSRILRPERYILVGSPAWKKRRLEDILQQERIVDFEASDTMTLAFLEHHGLQQHARIDRHFANNTDALADLVHLGAGYSVLSTEFAQPLIEQGKLISLSPRRHFDFALALTWFPRRHMPPYFRAALQAIR